MFGLPFKHIIKILVIGFILLLFGGNALALLAMLVTAFRYGNPLPFLALIATMSVMSYLESHVGFPRIIHRVYRWATIFIIGLSVVTAFFIGYTWGYPAAILIALFIIVLASIVNDWNSVVSTVRLRTIVVRSPRGMDLFRSTLSQDPSPDVNILTAPLENYGSLVQLMSSRSKLPLSMIVYSDFLALVLRVSSSDATFGARELLQSFGVEYVPMDTLLARLILSAPAIMDLSKMPGYVVVSQPEHLVSLKELPTEGMILSTNSGELVIAIPHEHAVGVPGVPVDSFLIKDAICKQSLSVLVN